MNNGTGSETATLKWDERKKCPMASDLMKWVGKAGSGPPDVDGRDQGTERGRTEPKAECARKATNQPRAASRAKSEPVEVSQTGQEETTADSPKLHLGGPKQRLSKPHISGVATSRGTPN